VAAAQRQQIFHQTVSASIRAMISPMTAVS
jgi:hypothetical protein